MRISRNASFWNHLATEDKLAAIVQALAPENVQQFLGLINYYGKFIDTDSSVEWASVQGLWVEMVEEISEQFWSSKAEIGLI